MVNTLPAPDTEPQSKIQAFNLQARMLADGADPIEVTPEPIAPQPEAPTPTAHLTDAQKLQARLQGIFEKHVKPTLVTEEVPVQATLADQEDFRQAMGGGFSTYDREHFLPTIVESSIEVIQTKGPKGRLVTRVFGSHPGGSRVYLDVTAEGPAREALVEEAKQRLLRGEGKSEDSLQPKRKKP